MMMEKGGKSMLILSVIALLLSACLVIAVLANKFKPTKYDYLIILACLISNEVCRVITYFR